MDTEFDINDEDVDVVTEMRWIINGNLSHRRRRETVPKGFLDTKTVKLLMFADLGVINRLVHFGVFENAKKIKK